MENKTELYEVGNNGYSSDEKMLSVLVWVGAYFSYILIPLLVYILKGKESKLIENHFKSCMNMLISYSMYAVILTIIFTFIGIFTLGVGFGLYAIVGCLPLVMIVIGVLGCIDALKGESRNYSTCIEFFKVK